MTDIMLESGSAQWREGLSQHAAAFSKLLISIARADAVVRPVEIECSTRILGARLGLEEGEARSHIDAAMARPEYERTLGSCLRSLGGAALPGLIDDLKQVSLSDGEFHANEKIVVEGLQSMLTSQPESSA
jgi:uncharacterized tellurite resistance protein B-like protein